MSKRRRNPTSLMKIAVASENRGFKAKDRILFQARELRHYAFDLGPSTDEICDYPNYAAKATGAVSKGEVDPAILIGATGICMSIDLAWLSCVEELSHQEIACQLQISRGEVRVLLHRARAHLHEDFAPEFTDTVEEP